MACMWGFRMSTCVWVYIIGEQKKEENCTQHLIATITTHLLISRLCPISREVARDHEAVPDH